MWDCTWDTPASPGACRPPRDDSGLVWLEAQQTSAAALREAVIRAGMDAVRFLRIDACPSGGTLPTVRALLCAERVALPALRAELLRRLPGCAWHEAQRRGQPHHGH